MYGLKICEILFQLLLQKRNLHINSKISWGDVFLKHLCTRNERINGGHEVHFVQSLVEKAYEAWLNPPDQVFKRFIFQDANSIVTKSPFAVVFDALDYETVDFLCENLSRHEFYWGALEIDDAYKVHWSLYQLPTSYRMVGRKLNVFWDGISEESKDHAVIEVFQRMDFEKVQFESLNGRYTIFDKNDNFEDVRRKAEFRRKSGGMLAFIAENAVTRIEDLVPSIGNKMWSAVDQLERAETSEQYAQVAATCRRILEVVVDAIEPPLKNDEIFGPGKHKNRLKKYADRVCASPSTVDLVLKSGDEFKQQLDRYIQLTSRGVHSDILFSDARRCFIRMLILVDDILALDPNQFKISVEYDLSLALEMAKKVVEDKD